MKSGPRVCRLLGQFGLAHSEEEFLETEFSVNRSCLTVSGFSSEPSSFAMYSVDSAGRNRRTLHFATLCRKTYPGKDVNTEISPLRSPIFPVELVGVGNPHAPFSTEKRIRGRCEFWVVGNPGTLRAR
jgi:hypothetical protein